MDANLQRRVQRYGWDKAVDDYEAGWRRQLEPAQSLMLRLAAVGRGERVLDVACGTGLISFRLAEAVGDGGTVVGTDISGEMIKAANRIADERGVSNTEFRRLDAEDLQLEGAEQFDTAVCGLGLMYVPDPGKALAEMYRVLRPGGRFAAAVWGARAKCGWAEIFPITDARVASEVCPMFFQLGTQDMLARAVAGAGFEVIEAERIEVGLVFESEQEALDAAFRGGPVALAYNRFDEATRAAVHGEYLDSIAAFRSGDGYLIPGEFVAVAGVKPGG
jgi:ubiquinone/menaquinone biosynthesis C-methylase UbiE